MAIGLLLNGVHGSGKTTLSKFLERLGFKRIAGDAAEVYKDRIASMDTYLRESLFIYHNHAAFSLFIDELRLGNNVVIDPSPLFSTPYVKYFLRENSKSLIRKNWKIYEDLISYLKKVARNSILVHVGLILENKSDISIITRRIKKRKDRKLLKKEEINEDYINYVNKEVIRLLRKLESKNEHVIYIQATLSVEEQAKRIMDYLKRNKLL